MINKEDIQTFHQNQEIKKKKEAELVKNVRGSLEKSTVERKPNLNGCTFHGVSLEDHIEGIEKFQKSQSINSALQEELIEKSRQTTYGRNPIKTKMFPKGKSGPVKTFTTEEIFMEELIRSSEKQTFTKINPKFASKNAKVLYCLKKVQTERKFSTEEFTERASKLLPGEITSENEKKNFKAAFSHVFRRMKMLNLMIDEHDEEKEGGKKVGNKKKYTLKKEIESFEAERLVWILKEMITKENQQKLAEKKKFDEQALKQTLESDDINETKLDKTPEASSASIEHAGIVDDKDKESIKEQTLSTSSPKIQFLSDLRDKFSGMNLEVKFSDGTEVKISSAI